MSTLMFDRLAAALGKAYAQIPFKVAAQDDTHHDGTIHECARDAVDGLVDAIIAAAEFDPKRFKAAVEEAKVVFGIVPKNLDGGVASPELSQVDGILGFALFVGIARHNRALILLHHDCPHNAAGGHWKGGGEEGELLLIGMTPSTKLKRSREKYSRLLRYKSKISPPHVFEEALLRGAPN